MRVLAPGRTVVYRWDGDVGPWRPAPEAILVPEGRHALHLATIDVAGRVTWEKDVHLKVAYTSPPINSPPGGRRRVAGSKLSDARSVGVRAKVSPVAGPILKRLGGRDRYETAGDISEETFASADTVILATGQDFADALASSGLAGSYGGPLLLTKRDALPAATRAELKRLGAKKVVITGGPPAVSEDVARTVRAMGPTVQRIGGRDRYATAALIAAELEKREGRRSTAFIARGDNFPDALAVSPFAFHSRSPILLVRPTSMPAATRAALSRGYFSDVVIAGGPAAVSTSVGGQIVPYADSVRRAGGSDRYATAAKAAKMGFSSGWTNYCMIGIATGMDFPDALCGGVSVGSRQGIVLLTRKAELPSATGRQVDECGPYLRLLHVFGGPAAVSEKVLEALRTIMR